jgi:hypothetical protein
MDFWGFESRQKLPGDNFGYFVDRTEKKPTTGGGGGGNRVDDTDKTPPPSGHHDKLPPKKTTEAEEVKKNGTQYVLVKLEKVEQEVKKGKRTKPNTLWTYTYKVPYQEENNNGVPDTPNEVATVTRAVEEGEITGLSEEERGIYREILAAGPTSKTIITYSDQDVSPKDGNLDESATDYTEIAAKAPPKGVDETGFGLLGDSLNIDPAEMKRKIKKMQQFIEWLLHMLMTSGNLYFLSQIIGADASIFKGLTIMVGAARTEGKARSFKDREKLFDKWIGLIGKKDPTEKDVAERERAKHKIENSIAEEQNSNRMLADLATEAGDGMNTADRIAQIIRQVESSGSV